MGTMVCSSAPFLLTLLGTYYPGEAYLQTRFFRQTQRELRVHTVREFAGICLEVDPTKSSINPPLLVQSHHTHTHTVYTCTCIHTHVHTMSTHICTHPHTYMCFCLFLSSCFLLAKSLCFLLLWFLYTTCSLP